MDFENCQLPIRPGYWYRRTAKELNAPFYLKAGGEVSVNVIDADNNSVKEIKLEGEKGLNFVAWDLMLDEENMVEAGTFKLQIKGDGFLEEKEFEIERRQRRR